MSYRTIDLTAAGGLHPSDQSRPQVAENGARTQRHTGHVPGETDQSDDDLAHAAKTFTAVRPRLFGIAYRMLSSSSDAEDVVQEAWMRWQNYEGRSTINDPAAFLATMTTRLSINVLQSAHARRETYIGPWLPEPVDTSSDPALGAERGEALGFAVLLLLEKLTPTERAAYILREAFDYPYPEIATRPIDRAGRPTTRQSGAQTPRRRAKDNCRHLGPTPTPRSLFGSCAERQRVEAGGALRRRCGQLYGWQWRQIGGSDPGQRPEPGGQVRGSLLQSFLDRQSCRLGGDQWATCGDPRRERTRDDSLYSDRLDGRNRTTACG